MSKMDEVIKELKRLNEKIGGMGCDKSTSNPPCPPEVPCPPYCGGRYPWFKFWPDPPPKCCYTHKPDPLHSHVPGFELAGPNPNDPNARVGRYRAYIYWNGGSVILTAVQEDYLSNGGGAYHIPSLAYSDDHNLGVYYFRLSNGDKVQWERGRLSKSAKAIWEAQDTAREAGRRRSY